MIETKRPTKMKIHILVILISIIFSNNIFAQQLSSSKCYYYKNKASVYTDNTAFIIDFETKKITELYKDIDSEFYITETKYITKEEVEKLKFSDPELYKYYTNDCDLYFNKQNNNLLSIVGPYISYENEYSSGGGAHPSYGKQYITYNLETNNKANLLDIFEKSDILEALLNDKIIQQHLSKMDPKDLDELFHHLYFEDLDFGKHILKQFAFHHIKNNKVAVRIGVTHGNEMARGTFAQIGIYLPIPKELKDTFTKAMDKKTLMKDMAKN